MVIHSLFDLFALAAALAVYRWLKLPASGAPAQPWQLHPLYIPAVAFGVTAGAYLVGSANLWLTGIPGIGRSISGALAGGIIAVEILKRAARIRGSTGLAFVAPLAAAIAVGRIGCFLAGLDDMTYGTPTALPWGVDFGDGVPRHPVQLYESATMAIFLVVFIPLLRSGNSAMLRSGFYILVGVYATQRFLWEFLKPYGTLIGPLNLFHLISLALIAYAIFYERREARRTCSTSLISSPRPNP